MNVCIAKRMSGGHSIEHIESLKWRDTGNGNVSYSTVSALVEYIDKGGRLYCARQGGGEPALVSVERPVGRKPYLRTVPNSTTRDNLLALPDF